MRYLLSFILLCCACLGLRGQNFNNIEHLSTSNDRYAVANMEISVCSEKISVYSSKNKALIEEIPFSSKGKGINHKLLYSNKLQQGFLFLEKHSELSEGCSIYKIEKGDIRYLCEFPFAAYTSENGERMDYNNILPYLSVIRSDTRTLLFINTPMIVSWPDSPKEEILETKHFYHILTNNGFELRNY